ncbi:ectoine/hydroxyectoine ABC transporter substrate-binding protein EhuB [Bacillus sp. P1(2020)]|uniref:Ectoine/hydroxyectoine ABC transporter substrate-binding protein EhuB n=2 Tax=Pallidibacillus pasinlerensis TaxID=2703818 RepID=A0ABX0ABQ1_9BACI|nr:ectoine/hydroxyectoine ABC transporter substrate-binding protein EhuB [Pallidibacillus pasinlerensis]
MEVIFVKRKVLNMLVILVLIVSGCSFTASNSEQSTLEKARAEGKIVVGFSGEVPYAYLDEDGNLTGESVEVARAIFKKLGIEEMEGKLVKFDSLIPGLQNGSFDVITAGMYITPDRCLSVDFAEPDYTIGEALAVQPGNPKDIHSYEDIAANEDITIAVMNGAIEIDYLKAVGVKDSQIEIVQDIPASIAAVESGRADATTMTGPTLENALKTANTDKIEIVEDFEQPVIDGESVRGYGAAAFRIGDDEIREAFNEELQKMKESGELLEIISEFGFTENEIPYDVTAAELCEG